ncbi:hypothetical protein LEMLEM_LOCUS7561, partial [Lemmus lemmus]
NNSWTEGWHTIESEVSLEDCLDQAGLQIDLRGIVMITLIRLIKRKNKICGLAENAGQVV